MSVGQRVETGAQRACTGSSADQLLQHHVPADDERHELADGDVAVAVGAAGGVRNAHTELGVTDACIRSDRGQTEVGQRPDRGQTEVGQRSDRGQTEGR